MINIYCDKCHESKNFNSYIEISISGTSILIFICPECRKNTTLTQTYELAYQKIVRKYETECGRY